MRLTLIIVQKRDATERKFVATGFVMQDDDRGLWLVTNRHVLDPAFHPVYDGTWYLERILIEGTAVRFDGDSLIQCEVRDPKPRFHACLDVDIAVLGLPDDSDLRDASFRLSDLVHEHEIDDDEIGVGSEFVMPGYPTLDNGTGVRPILVPGLVSSDLRYDAEYGDNIYVGQGLCHAFSRGGMSGAPMLTTIVRRPFFGDSGDPTREVKVLGVNCGHPTEKNGVSALSMFVPSWRLDELFAEAGNVTAGLRVRLSEANKKLRDG